MSRPYNNVIRVLKSMQFHHCCDVATPIGFKACFIVKDAHLNEQYETGYEPLIQQLLKANNCIDKTPTDPSWMNVSLTMEDILAIDHIIERNLPSI